MVLTGALLSTLFGQLTKDLTKAIDDNSEKTKIVIVKQNPDTYSITEIDNVKTTSKKWRTKDSPNLEFENALEKESIVKEISILPDTNFKTKGKILITIDDVVVFKSKSFTAFENVADNIVKINKTINQDSKVKVFLVSSDETEVGVTIQVTFGE